MVSINDYLDDLYNELIKKNNDVFNHDWQFNLREKVKESLGEFISNSTDFNTGVLEKEDMGTYERMRVEITTFYPLRMPLYILIPKNRLKGKLPAVLTIHGHGYGVKEALGLNPDGTESECAGVHNNFARKLVEKGVVVVAPELVGFGDRKLEEDIGKGKPEDNSCYRIASQLLLMGKTLAGLRVYECRRVIDFIQSLTYVNQKQIGCFGLSGGALVTAFTSMIDVRIKAAVLAGYTNTFKGSIMDRRHCLDNYIPGILQLAELPELIGLIAPRPLFIESGTKDHLFPLKYVHTALAKLEIIYESMGSKKDLSSSIFEGGHEIDGKESIDWIVRQLRK
ncbi:alpha/beta hydrolase [Oceanobacillus sp. FSL H7-0719]|uniref:alpha/beta hydrolase n=1 Tax=Oceanobacillus sp. FSL H7-0719 TaxID=2954507 RepID=UPI0032489ACE